MTSVPASHCAATWYMLVFKNISYTSTPNVSNEFDLYTPQQQPTDSPAAAPLICFVHGGAWRSEDKADHSLLACKLVEQSSCCVAVPNYCLTPRDPTEHHYLHHPAHAEDLLLFLNYVVGWQGPAALTALPYDPQRLYLVGHSCSAHMLTSIFLDSSSLTPTLTPSPSLLRVVQGIVMSEGIYDLELLLDHFPQYRDFVVATFGEEKPLSNFASTKHPLRNSSTHIRWLVIHSTGDQLVDPPQSEAIFHHLSLLYGPQAEHFVLKNFDELTGSHNGILVEDDYVKIVRDFVVDV